MSNQASYADCVSSLTHSLSFLTSAVQTLESATSDLPRLATVLQTTRHYELIPSARLAAAEASLRDEIGPSIALLLDRAEAQVDRRDRRIETLKARSDLLAGRLAAGDSESTATAHGSGSRSRPKSAAAAGAGERRHTLAGERGLKARAVRSRKEGLKYSVERLELEVSQKERELRKRLEKAS
ncbi:hypothetical protein SODALDRAFT_330800 [Sodiomyces alkalinus F11]|uniref:DASH complex subunit SPC19 n=1 Tax=Sodiomyces alkalinus (strain CBS 110278 / VKM F-3762 / F11) TaxID=1314773 RepID=A0A3N2Q2T8_SODAK|nr:hypothetical protein SODALDRAFT_332668 [Sodiomyces alkalinus F11]XP_028468887.1 hypothetical protein SODALDRAFT_330800 [Sodiomyces alkalinus F11]ROT39234.1 hypothetical protein SODALDRAFT_332668 [Sodiomyces alkalinus F11]ROT41081.1 hypothetical protein SODALDRAFT_330800 [Sodiomyces alkalinus F11]